MNVTKRGVENKMTMLNSNSSELLRRFRERTQVLDAAEGIITCVRAVVRRLSGIELPVDMNSVMRARQINEVKFDADLNYDGHIEPMGSDFGSGFRIVARGGIPETRLRFTLAHEVCHTFFYEIVPELKYIPHVTSSAEERLCNLGASELLMPSDRLAGEHLTRYPGLRSLELLAGRYQVSIESMLIRLTSSKLWQCQMAQWYRLPSGRFMLDRLCGGAFRNWRLWITDEMNKVWEERGSQKRGECYASLTDRERNWGSDRIYYEMKRRGDRLVMLWSACPLEDNPSDAPLFLDNPASPFASETGSHTKRRRMAGQQPTFFFLGASLPL